MDDLVYRLFLNITNLTEGEISKQNLSHVKHISVFLATVFILGISLNVISITVILRTKKMDPISILILNLAIADIIYTLGLVNK